jgi:hypothetical protein
MTLDDDPIASGMAALSCGEWTTARTHFEGALAREETPEALDGLSDALYWLDEIETSLDRRTRAYVLYREQGNRCRAVRAALWLVWGHFGSYGNFAVANGWLQRAERLLQEAGDCAERGWSRFSSSTITRLEWARAVTANVHNSDVAREYARLALAVLDRLGARLYA